MKWIADSITRILLIAMLAYAGVASSTVVYDEASSGDLSTFDVENIVLVSGVSSVVGSGDTPESFDFDGFFFTVGSGLELVGISYAFSNVEASFQTFAVSYGIFESGHQLGPLGSGTAIDLLGVSPQSFSSVPYPIGEGTYAFSPLSGQGLGTWDYSVDFVTRDVAVSAPATLALLGLGLAGIGYTRKKNNKVA